MQVRAFERYTPLMVILNYVCMQLYNDTSLFANFVVL